MPESSPDVSTGHQGTDICGGLSLLCGFPLLILILSGGRADLPGRVYQALFWSIFASPFIGALLALIAAIGRRWWLVLLAVWLAILGIGWWNFAHHPFDL
jgi:hypothetical protein